MKILKISALWLAVAFLCLVGAFCFIFPGYSFTGLVCLGILAVIFCYRLLYRLGKRKLLRILTVNTLPLPRLANIPTIPPAVESQSDVPLS